MRIEETYSICHLKSYSLTWEEIYDKKTNEIKNIWKNRNGLRETSQGNSEKREKNLVELKPPWTKSTRLNFTYYRRNIEKKLINETQKHLTR